MKTCNSARNLSRNLLRFNSAGSGSIISTPTSSSFAVSVSHSRGSLGSFSSRISSCQFTTPSQPQSQPQPQPRRHFSSSIPTLSRDTTWLNKGDVVNYSELKPETEAPSGKITLIDVREPDEVSSGMIPSSVNVPLTRFSEAFHSNKGANFSREFAFERPSFDDRIVFYCRSGKRSQQAMELARRNGWWNTRNYSGSYLDWVQQEEARSKK